MHIHLGSNFNFKVEYLTVLLDLLSTHIIYTCDNKVRSNLSFDLFWSSSRTTASYKESCWQAIWSGVLRFLTYNIPIISQCLVIAEVTLFCNEITKETTASWPFWRSANSLHLIYALAYIWPQWFSKRYKKVSKPSRANQLSKTTSLVKLCTQCI